MSFFTIGLVRVIKVNTVLLQLMERIRFDHFINFNRKLLFILWTISFDNVLEIGMNQLTEEIRQFIEVFGMIHIRYIHQSVDVRTLFHEEVRVINGSCRTPHQLKQVLRVTRANEVNKVLEVFRESDGAEDSSSVGQFMPPPCLQHHDVSLLQQQVSQEDFVLPRTTHCMVDEDYSRSGTETFGMLLTQGH